MSTSTADSKKRVVLPRARPGEVYDIEQQGEGRFRLVRLAKPEPPTARLSRKTCLEAMQRAPLRLTTTWEKLRELTREP